MPAHGKVIFGAASSLSATSCDVTRCPDDVVWMGTEAGVGLREGSLPRIVWL
jgi:hypothetical protein